MRRIGPIALAIATMLFTYLAYVYLSLPDVRPLRTIPPATTAFIELREKEARARGQTPRRDQRWIPYDRISSDLKRAVIVAEDSRFWEHEGIDMQEIEKSLEINWARGRFVRGASTITQQLAKNLYLSPSKNPFRKLRELLITRRLEAELSKRRILELYLNEIEWGDGIYGAEAAARRYFKTSASALGPEQSALLAAAIINPHELNPAQPTRRLRSRQRLIRLRMGRVTPPESSRPAALDPAPQGPAPDLPVEGDGPPEEEGIRGTPDQDADPPLQDPTLLEPTSTPEPGPPLQPVFSPVRDEGR